MADDKHDADLLLRALGLKIRQIRVEAGLSQARFARLAGMNPGYAWRLEEGRQNMNVTTLARIASALDVTIAALFQGIELEGERLPTRPWKPRGADSQE